MNLARIKKIGSFDESGQPIGWELDNSTIDTALPEDGYSPLDLRNILEHGDIPQPEMYTPEEMQALKDQIVYTSALAHYNLADAKIAEWKKDFMILKIKDLSDKDTYEKVYESRQIVKNTRVGIEKKRKELKAPLLKMGERIDNEAKRLTTDIAEIETYLEKEEEEYNKLKDADKREKLEKKQALIKSRVSLLMATGVSFDGLRYFLPLEQIMSTDPEDMDITMVQVSDMTDEEFSKKLTAFQSEAKSQQTKKDEETARLKKEREDLARQRLEIETEKAELTILKEEIVTKSEQMQKSFHYPSPDAAKSIIPGGFTVDEIISASKELGKIITESGSYAFSKKLEESSDSEGVHLPDILTKENFWNDLKSQFPEQVEHFCKWVDEYKVRVKWQNIFWTDPYGPVPGGIKFHHLPSAMQIGVISQYISEMNKTGNMGFVLIDIIKWFGERSGTRQYAESN